jgi:tetratricopeptide (TPR) repeat protein
VVAGALLADGDGGYSPLLFIGTLAGVMGFAVAFWVSFRLNTLYGPMGQLPRAPEVEAALHRYELRRDTVSALVALVTYFIAGLWITVSYKGGWPAVEGYLRAHLMDGFGYALFFALGWKQLERHAARALRLFGLATAVVAAGAAFTAGGSWLQINLAAALGLLFGQYMWEIITRFAAPAAADARRLLGELQTAEPVTAHIERGSALLALGRSKDALAAYDQALALSPGNAIAHMDRGTALLALGESEDALAADDQALALSPGYAIAHMNRGNALQALGRSEDALAAYDQALALDPGNAIAHMNRGTLLQALGRSEDALAAYDQALATDPDLAVAHENKGIVLAVIGDLDRALAELDTAGRLAPTGAGEGRAWAAAILWNRRDAAGARDRFALVNGRVTGCTPFHAAEMEAIALCGLGQPGDAERRLLDAAPQRAPGDGVDTRVIYDLLSDPPLPGIDRLHAMVEKKT